MFFNILNYIIKGSSNPLIYFVVEINIGVVKMNKRFKNIKKVLSPDQPISKPYAHGWEVLVETFKFDDLLIEEGYKWDGASIPWIFWRIIGSPFLPQFRKASLVHDYYCGDKPLNERSKGDKIFKNNLKAQGVKGIVASVMYLAVSGKTLSLKFLNLFKKRFSNIH